MNKDEYTKSLLNIFRLEVKNLDGSKKEEFIRSLLSNEFSSRKSTSLYCPSCGVLNLVEWPNHQSYLRVKCESCKKISSNYIATIKSKRRSERYDRKRFRGYTSPHRDDHFLYTFRVITPEKGERQFELVDGERNNFEVRAKDEIALSYLGFKGKELIITNLTVNKARKMICLDEEFLLESKEILRKLKPINCEST